jgi:histidyl-tRNA synthetase
MTKQNLQTLKGFRDFLPEQMRVRSFVVGKMCEVFERFGFEELQTPVLEAQEVLLGKYGEEAEKQMYLFEDRGKRKVGMRYDLTVPLARAIASNPQVSMPFKRYQIQPVWRTENTQKGRYREFYQCDIDIVGSSSPIADAEVIAVINAIFKTLSFKEYKIRINSRAVLFSTMERSGISEDKWLAVIQSIDKLDKKSREEVEKELSEKGVASEAINSIFANLRTAKPDEFLSDTIELAKNFGVSDNKLVFDPILSRGLDYYTGPIFESFVEEPVMGSLTGGGRYDKLFKTLGGPDLPATGTTIGLERIIDVISELGMISLDESPVKVLVTVFDKKLLGNSVELANYLRSKKVNTELYLNPEDRLGKQLKYADKKGIPFVVIIGEEEVRQNKVTLKELASGGSKLISPQDLPAILGV